MLLSIASALMIAQAAPAAAPAVDPEKKICKRGVQIGSLVRAKKICRTKADWNAQEAQARQDVLEMQRTSRAPNKG